jgi:flavin reductase (DIM6/NTAB) family NADH-FMN oxidoreductase RutF
MAHVECQLVQTYDGGDHTIIIGEILSAAASGERPLLFFRGKYHKLPPS